MTTRKRKQALAAAYGAGQIKQALIAGEYPPPEVEVPKTPWPQGYSMGPRKLGPITYGKTVTGRFPSEPEMQSLIRTPDDVQKLAAITPEQAREVMGAVMGTDFAELERRILAMMQEDKE